MKRRKKEEEKNPKNLPGKKNSASSNDESE